MTQFKETLAAACARRDTHKDSIAEYAKSRGTVTVKDIAASLGLQVDYVRCRMNEMQAAGTIHIARPSGNYGYGTVPAEWAVSDDWWKSTTVRRDALVAALFGANGRAS